MAAPCLRRAGRSAATPAAAGAAVALPAAAPHGWRALARTKEGTPR